MQVFLGIDVGGTKIAVVASDPAGRILGRAEGPTGAQLGPDQVVGRMAAYAREALAAAGVPESALVAAGLGLPGPVDAAAGTTIQTPNIPGLAGYPVVQVLQERLGAPVYIENDANLAALGEWAYGAGAGARHILYLTVSTGIGGGFVLDGQVYSGAHGSAGEVGHVLAEPGGRLCGCGRRGCLEAHASGTAIGAIASEALAAGSAAGGGSAAGAGPGRGSRLREMVDPETGRVTAAQVALAAREGDDLAAGIWNRAMYQIGTALGDLANLLDPERILLGGGVAKAGEQMLAPVRAAAAERAMPGIARHLDIRLCELGGNAGALGAAAYACLRSGVSIQPPGR